MMLEPRAGYLFVTMTALVPHIFSSQVFNKRYKQALPVEWMSGEPC